MMTEALLKIKWSTLSVSMS